MTDRLKQIGFSQRVRLEWFEQTANLVLAGNDRANVTAALREGLREKFTLSGRTPSGNLDKVISILLKTWVEAPTELQVLQSDGLNLLKQLERERHIAVHWGMALAIYPFWGAVAAQTGRLLNLQASVAAAQVQRRITEQYGERETVTRAARRILRTFIDWSVLTDTPEKGIYVPVQRIVISEPELITWLVEATLRGRTSKVAQCAELLDSPVLFPFHLTHLSAQQITSLSPRLELLRHGLDDDLIMVQRDT